jgi:hypothetical protein
MSVGDSNTPRVRRAVRARESTPCVQRLRSSWALRDVWVSWIALFLFRSGRPRSVPRRGDRGFSPSGVARDHDPTSPMERPRVPASPRSQPDPTSWNSDIRAVRIGQDRSAGACDGDGTRPTPALQPRSARRCAGSSKPAMAIERPERRGRFRGRHCCGGCRPWCERAGSQSKRAIQSTLACPTLTSSAKRRQRFKGPRA